MNWKNLDPRTRTRLIAGSILLIGLGVALGVYLRADSAPDDMPWELTPDSKKYMRSLQMYGGTANVMMVELMDWFGGLWHGRTLAATIAVISIIVSCAYLWLATLWLPPTGGGDGID
jgi:hypothetical protein